MRLKLFIDWISGEGWFSFRQCIDLWRSRVCEASCGRRICAQTCQSLTLCIELVPVINSIERWHNLIPCLLIFSGWKGCIWRSWENQKSPGGRGLNPPLFEFSAATLMFLFCFGFHISVEFFGVYSMEGIKKSKGRWWKKEKREEKWSKTPLQGGLQRQIQKGSYANRTMNIVHFFH